MEKKKLKKFEKKCVEMDKQKLEKKLKNKCGKKRKKL